MFKFQFGEPVSEAEEGVTGNENNTLQPPRVCNFDRLKKRAPRISYSTDQHGLRRRDLFDVRFELMSLNEVSEDERCLLTASDNAEDVRKSVYEGGLKVWEGANDLVEVLKSTNLAKSTVLELGCGAAVPSVYFLEQALRSGSKATVVLCDYNAAVLELLTMPNVLLAWLSATGRLENDVDELVISSELISEMELDLASRGVSVHFVAGAWGKTLEAEVLTLAGARFDLILASETIYSLDTVNEFTEVLCNSLGPKGTGLVAAKRVYFGVGGGVVEFERLLDERNVHHEVVFERGNVGRVVLQVRLP